MNNYGIVSIIVPIYKVEKYLSQCIQSLCDQTYPYLEILLVDDESPDQSGEIADAYAKKDDRIRVFHEKNRGAAGARNIGLNHATGDYVAFVDSDDWLEDDYIEKMLTTLIKEKADIVQCQFMDEALSGGKEHIYHKTGRTIRSEDFVREMLIHWEYILLWNKLYRKNTIGRIRMLEGHCIDDEFFTYRVIMNADRICLMDDLLYHYRLRRSSAMGNRDKAVTRYKDQVDFITERYAPLVRKYPALKSEILSHLIGVLIEVMRASAWDNKSYDYAKKALKHYSGKAMVDRKISTALKKSMAVYLLSDRKKIDGIPGRQKAESQEDYYE